MEFELGLALFTGLDPNGFQIAQYDGHGSDPRVDASSLQHSFGFVSRPRDPEVDSEGNPKEGKACTMWVAHDGDQVHSILGYDPRYVSTFPKLKKGGSMQYSAPGSFVVLDGDDGTYTAYVPIKDGDEVTKAHAFTIGQDGNQKPYVGLIHADGMALLFLEGSAVLKNKSGSAYIEVNDDGINLSGNVKAVGGMLVGNVAAAQPLVMWPQLVALLTAIAGVIDTKLPPAPGACAALVTAAQSLLQTTLIKGL